MYLFLFLCVTLYMFRAHRAHHQERQIVSTQSLVTVSLFTVGGRVVSHDTVTDIQWQLPEIVFTLFVPPDDEHDVLETCRELKINTQNRIVRHVGHLPRTYKFCL